MKNREVNVKSIVIVLLLIGVVSIVCFQLFTKKSTIEYTLLEGNIITKKGYYRLEGDYSCISIETNDKVFLRLSDVNIKCNNGPAIKSEGELNIAVLSNNIKIESITGDKNIPAISSKENILIYGPGKIEINSDGDGINLAKDIDANNINLNIASNKGKGIKANNIALSFVIGAISADDDAINSNGELSLGSNTLLIESGDDAIHADDNLSITRNQITITNCIEGIEGKNVDIKESQIDITTKNDGINSVGDEKHGLTSTLTINSTSLKIISDLDGIDCNGDVNINNSEVYIESKSMGKDTALDHNGYLDIKGGSVIALSNSEGKDIGERNSNNPSVYTKVEKISGEVSIGKVSFKPIGEFYTYIFISDEKLTKTDSLLKYGDKEKKVSLTTGKIDLQ